MILELGLLSVLGPLYWYRIIGLRSLLGISLFFYWLPKPVIVGLLNNLLPRVITHVQTNRKTVALTFDDVPYGASQEILTLLNRYKFRATLFIISDNVNPENEDLLIEAVKRGHQLGNHGKTNSAHAIKSYQKAKDEIETCHNKIVEIYAKAGVPLPKNMVYRPGCGVPSPNLFSVCEEMGYKLTLGSVYPNDPLFRFPLINYLYVKWHLDKDDVVILHDRKWTPPMLKWLLPWMVGEGFEGRTLDEGLRE